jgi:DNA-binding SARP family transcriptional activator/WD40 repeat protein
MAWRGGVVETERDVRALDLRVLGQVDVRVDGTPAALGGRKQRGVLAVLVAAGGRPVSVDSLLLATYGESASPGGKATLHTYVSNLRRLLGDVIVRKGDAYLLDCTGATIDAVEFEELCVQAAAIEDPDRSATVLRQALSLWRGHPYADIDANGRLDGEITRLAELRAAALESRIDADLRAGRHREVVGELDALTAEYPYRESLRVLHMLALYRCGRQAEALRVYSRTRESLVEDLGIDPSVELQEMQRRILAQDRDLLISTVSTVRRSAVLVADLDEAGWHGPWERDAAFGRRDDDLEAVAAAEGGTRLAPRGSAAYVVFAEPLSAVRAARSVVNERTMVAVDVGDLELGEGDPVGPPLARAARLVAIAHPGQVLLSSAAHDALAADAHTGWAAESLGRVDVIGLDPGTHVYQLVGGGFGSEFPPLRTDRLPPPLPGGAERSVPGYELRELIGTGQLGEVHRAYQPSVGREVALRTFGRAMVTHPRFVRRFETVAQRITRVEHPHVVPLLDYWREPDRAVMVTRLVTGGSLAERIPRHGLDPARALEIVEPIGSALASAHRHGVAHGRLRPENVLFDAEDNAFLADLGIDEICAGVITFASSAYDAPERLGGVLATPASDVYSLGVLVEQLLSGSPPPFDGALDIADGPASCIVGRATDPDPDRRHHSIDELVGELRAAFSVPASPAAPFAPARNPYRGLEPFEQADADDFFGRDRSVAEMVDILRHETLLIVLGPSGIGKSSAVKAGLLPALTAGAVPGSETWLMTELVPGREPFENLAAALERVASVELADVVGKLMSQPLGALVDEAAPGNRGVLIVIDQLEELFTQTVDDAARRCFLRMLVDVANAPGSNVRVVATLRADYLDRPLSHPGVEEAIQGRTVVLGAMPADELADSVRLPAAAVGLQIEPGVVERIVAEAELQPGALPLVQHTLSELFLTRSTNTVTVANLDEVGGVAGAIGRRAEQVYQSLDERCQIAAHTVFLRLVSVTEEHGDTRRRVRRTELEQASIAPEDLDTVLAAYGRHRLLTFDRDPATRTPTVELAHEALLTDWARFAGWVDDARDDLLARRRVESATRDWITAGADASFLYGGGRLELAESWAADSPLELGADERRFLEASREKAVRDQAHRSKRRRIMVGLLSAAVVVAMVLAAVAYAQRRNADRQADERRSGELAKAATLAVDEDPERAILLAQAAMGKTEDPSPDVISALHRATQSARLIRKVEGVVSGSMDLSPDGSLIAVDRLDRSGYELIDTASGRTVADVTTGLQIVDWFAFGFDPTGSTLAVAVADQDGSAPAIEVHDVASGRLVRTLPGRPGDYLCCSIQFDPTGRWLGSLDGDHGAVVWDLVDSGAARSFDGVHDFEFAVDGSSIVVIGDDATLTTFDVANGQQLSQFATPQGVEYGDLELDPTGHLASLYSQLAARVDVVDMTTGEVKHTIALRDPTFAQFSRDGNLLAVASNDGLIRIYDTDSFVERERLVGTSGGPIQIVFAPDGTRLVSARPGEVRIWDVSTSGRPQLGNFHVSGDRIDRLVVSGDESTAYATTYTNYGDVSAVHRIDIGSGTDDEVLGDVHYYFSTRPLVSPDLSVVATPDQDFVTSIAQLPSGQSKPLAPCESVRAFDQQSRVAAIDSFLVCFERGQDTRATNRIVDLQTGASLLDLGETAIYAAAIGPPGDDGLPQWAVVEEAGSWIVDLYDLTARKAVATYVPKNDRVTSLASSPDGRRLALLTDNGRLIVLDVDRWADGDDAASATVLDIVAHASGSKAVAYSASGMIATASSADGLRVWSPDGELVASVPTHQDDDPTFTFATGTDTLYYEDGDGVVRRFEIDLGHVSRLARSVLSRGFTTQECQRYFPGEPCPTFDT